MSLLELSKDVYPEVYHASAACMPFADNSFDFVVSCDVVGHLPSNIKDAFFKEMFRVLKPGGRAVHVIETESTNWWYGFAHQYPELFQKHFVDRPGHISMELASELRERFFKAGFKEIVLKKMNGGLPEFGIFSCLFNNEFKTKNRWIAFLADLDGLICKNLVVREFTHLLITPFAAIYDHFASINDGSCALTIHEKPPAN